VENGFARNRLVTAGQRGPHGIAILSGLSEGEKVVTSPSSMLADGAPVEVRP
jgi:multidrug efflux pump subunit AcrA (membrane-fusion protein)